jgi:hypothetical protein
VGPSRRFLPVFYGPEPCTAESQAPRCRLRTALTPECARYRGSMVKKQYAANGQGAFSLASTAPILDKDSIL